jgi:hypothetical protein
MLGIREILAGSVNPGAYALDSKPYGMSYEDCTIKFWQWLASIPADKNPVTDQTGERCGEEQGNLPVFFLAFSNSGGAQRTCTIPTGKAILVPINVVLVSKAEFPDAKNDDDLHRLAEEDESSNPDLFLSVDGKQFQDLEKYRVHSRPFEVNISSDHPFGFAGPTLAVSDGYWVILEPLPPGKHDIHFKARLTKPNTSTIFYSDDLKYIINVS